MLLHVFPYLLLSLPSCLLFLIFALFAGFALFVLLFLFLLFFLFSGNFTFCFGLNWFLWWFFTFDIFFLWFQRFWLLMKLFRRKIRLSITHLTQNIIKAQKSKKQYWSHRWTICNNFYYLLNHTYLKQPFLSINLEYRLNYK